MPPNNYAARLREMAEYERSKAEEWHRQSTMMLPTSGYSNVACARARQIAEGAAAALLAGAEALEACEKLRAFADELAEQNMPVLHGTAYQLDRLLPKEEESDV